MLEEKILVFLRINQELHPFWTSVEFWILPTSVHLLTERLTGHIRQLRLKSSDVSNVDVKEGAELRNSQAHPRNGHISKAAATVY